MTQQNHPVTDHGTSATITSGADATWWRHALVHQIYPRSFADANGDGI